MGSRNMFVCTYVQGLGFRALDVAAKGLERIGSRVPEPAQHLVGPNVSNFSHGLGCRI